MLISSHDLAEIESFATHIGFLHGGRLQFSQSLTDLAERFREIEVTLDAAPTLPRDWPAGWLRPEAASAVVRFVDSQFDEARTLAEVRRIFGERARVAVNRMPLRAIFVALAKQARKQAA